MYYETWWRFSQKLKKCLNHGLTERHLKQAFYRSLNYVTKLLVDAVCAGSFMRKPFSESIQLMDKLSKNNRARYTWDTKVGDLGYTFELSVEQRKREEERDQDTAHMRTQIDLLTKHIFSKSEKISVVSQPNRFEDQDIDLDEEANYLGNQGGFRNYNSGNQGYNSGNVGRNFSREGQYDRLANREHGNWQNRDGYRNDRSGVYGPQGNSDRASGSSSGSKLEDMLAKMLQKVESTDAGVNERKNGSLPSDTIQNPKKDGHYMASATRSGKIRTDPISTGTKHEQVLEQARRDEDEAEQVDDLEDSQPIANPTRVKEKEVEGTLALQQIPRPPPHFPQRLKKKVEDGKFAKFSTMFAIATRSMVQKKEDPGKFTIPYTIGSIEFAKALCDLGASINLMPLAIYKQLGLGVPKPTTMRLIMADRSGKRLVGILCNVLVKVDTFIFPTDFVILDCEVDFEVSIILGRPFLTTGRAMVDVERGELKFGLNKEKVKFNICKSMKQPRDMNVVSAIAVFDEEEIGETIEERMAVETLVAVLMNFEVFRFDYVETVNALRLPSHLRYVFLGTNNTLPVILAADLNDEQVQALIKVLIRYKRAIGWTIADIIGIPLVTGSVQCNVCPKWGGMTVVANAKNELVPQRPVTRWRVCMDYRKLNKWTLKDHFSMPFMDQMLDRLAGKGWYYVLDGYSGYNQISIAHED
ncbi:uncharacterized protein LOC125816504 [Solanum verrucosum]|uniref:uncharacterized protein LOC125816504 n=1 Tax=Solanum verrucosum TaxID=315347 RepID=UPI0020D02CF9|nr:uncharacterized protein LOC125816504 [Solanum verrucosum]